MRPAIGLHRDEHYNSDLATSTMVGRVCKAYRLALGRSNMIAKCYATELMTEDGCGVHARKSCSRISTQRPRTILSAPGDIARTLLPSLNS